MGYNGWANYETWAVTLWMDNDCGSYEYGRELARGAEGRGQLAATLKDEYGEAMPELEGVWADLLGAAFESVDWFEIAESLISEVEEEDAYDEGDRYMRQDYEQEDDDDG